ncbi:MAG: preprotein translocase subunit SecE [Clostridia bacterium]|nr:preprotein translocase subunit SecE [Clostridia bacterium]
MAENEKKVVEEKKEKKAKTKGPSIFSRIGSWFKSLRSEARKVSWASGSSVRKNTIIVIVCVVILSAVIGVVDYLLSGSINALSDIIRG